MSRAVFIALVIALAAPSVAFAQKAEAPPRFTISPRTGPRSQGWPRDPMPRFSIPPRGGIGLPPIGLPLPPHGLQPPPTDGRGHHNRSNPGWYPWWPTFGYIGVPYYAPYEPIVDPEPVAAVEQPAPTGRLILESQPEGTQVFVDGYYAGVPENYTAVDGGGVLEAGTHRVDLAAPGYESINFHVRIAANQTVTYRDALKKLPPLAVSSGPTTFYLIPGCYMGNVPPKDAHLPATCDLKRVVEFKY